MSLTNAQQTQLLQLTQALFGAAPGATYLSILGDSLNAGQTLANIAQTLTSATLFFGKNYAANLSPSQFASSFINDLVGNRASVADKAFAVTYITDKMAAGAGQADIITELTQILSSIPSDHPNWGVAAAHYNTGLATKIVDNLIGNSASAANKAAAIGYIVEQMAAGQSLGSLIDWAITVLDSVDHTDANWGSAASLFDNRTEVAKYYSVDKAGNALDLGTLQQVLKTVTADAGSVAAAKALFDNPHRGVAQDGYIAGATVTVKVPGQPDVVVTTDAQGNFTLPPGVFGTITVTGGTDISTNLPFTGTLTAPAGSTTANPLTTLQQSFVDKGLSAAQAQDLGTSTK
ncbi:MAG: hypothetical protein ACNA7G_14105 [Methylobacter sp.]